MSDCLESTVTDICAACGDDRRRLLDIVTEVQRTFGCVSGAAMEAIAETVNVHRVEVEGVVSFYSFLSDTPKGRTVIRLCDDIIDEMRDSRQVAQAFSDELGIAVGETTADGAISLEYTPCIGMCDQGPAALINDVVVTHLSCDAARDIVGKLRRGVAPRHLIRNVGDGNNAHEHVRSMVVNNIRQRGPVVFAELESGVALRKALAMHPAEVINEVNAARLRGRGGAGFPTGMKWDFTRKAGGNQRYMICNADEGEPGTFKDRVILTECADLMFEGMTIGAYAIGADTGIVYLRGEYAYLRTFLESRLRQRRAAGLLGKDICGKTGVDFDIRIQMGAGAYICGEETALIGSCEGFRGAPKTRPPFPAQQGYLGKPTCVNNVETFCCVACIIDRGAGWFAQRGSRNSSGTKLLSVSGDCMKPGVYELPFGISLREILRMVGGEDAIGVQVGGPSGQMVAPSDYDRSICYDDLATGGSIMVFGPDRDLLAAAAKFVEFFIEESCGCCTPCRVGGVLLKNRLDKIRQGHGEPADLDLLRELGATMKVTSRCGLGQAAANPVLTTLASFPHAFEDRISVRPDGLRPQFDIKAALARAEGITGRDSVHF